MSTAAIQLAPMAIAAVGSLVQGVSQAGQAKRAGAAADQNADLAEQQGEAEAGLIRERAKRLAATNRTNAGASGVDISGFMDALSDSDISAEQDAQTAVRNAKVQADNFRAQGKADSSSGNSALIGGGFGAGTAALQGYGNWKLLQANGSGTGAGGYSWGVPTGVGAGAR